MMTWQMHCGDALSVLRTLPEASVQCVVTSPPYWNLRDYGCDGQVGQEESPDEYVETMVRIMTEARRVLADDGTLWLNIGDAYAASGRGGNPYTSPHKMQSSNIGSLIKGRRAPVIGYKAKDLIGLPWMVAFALRADGWYLRSDSLWAKPNPMRESTSDRPTRAHEYVFLLSKSERYWYDAEAVRTKLSPLTLPQCSAEYFGEDRKDYDGADVQRPGEMKARIVKRIRDKQRGHSRRHAGFNDRWDQMEREDQIAGGAHCTTVWWIPTEGSEFEHFAVMPRRLARRCIRAGCPEGGVVLDMFAGTATTGVVAIEEGRNFIGVELNPKYHAIARQRLEGVAPLLAQERVS